jgi:subtilase family serine protease
VSDPASPNYGQWWSSAAILDLVAPPAHVSRDVASFLVASGATNVENRRDMIKCEMEVRHIETLFQTSMSVFRHNNGKNIVIRTQDGYTIPSEIAAHVELISGLEEFPEPRNAEVRSLEGVSDGYVTVPHIQELYSIPASFPNNKASSIGLIEFEDNPAFLFSDLSLFAQQMAIPSFNVSKIVGPFNESSPNLESTLDVQYGGAIAINSTVWFWTEDGWMYEFATDILNTENPPLVVSMSWGWPEPMQCQVDPTGCSSSGGSFKYVTRVNVEFQKIGLNGITLVAASGDQGAPGDGNYECMNTTNPFSTIFPGASPWVLSVGATMLESFLGESAPSADEPPVCKQVKCSKSSTEEACSYPDALITSGGGFSNISPRPSFQDDVVSAYFASGKKIPDSSYFNKSNRAFPDVSALGHNYLIASMGQFGSVDGTSCSSPVMAGIIALLNSERLNNGKTPLGYVVPMMYAAYAADHTTFKDITKGNNKCTENCCAKEGYETAKGWDPVTGLGTPQFPELLAYVQNLK